MDILHRIGVKAASPDKVYDALTTVDGLAGWWTDDATGSADVGGVLEFRFVPRADQQLALISKPRSSPSAVSPSAAGRRPTAPLSWPDARRS